MRRPATPGFVDVTPTCPPLLPDLSTLVADVDTASPEVRSSTGFGAGAHLPDVPPPIGRPDAAPDRSAPDAVPGQLPAGPHPRRGGIDP